MTRRELLRHFGTMTAAAIALPLTDIDKLIWTPKPIVVVSEIPRAFGGTISYSLFFAGPNGTQWIELETLEVASSLITSLDPADQVERMKTEERIHRMANSNGEGEWLLTERRK